MIARLIKRTLHILALLACGIASLASATNFVPPPLSIAEYLDTSHLIVVGRIGPVHRLHVMHGYDVIAPQPNTPGLQMVDYEVQVQEVLMDDASYPVATRTPLILRLAQSHNSVNAPAILAGNEGLFVLFLARNPDNATYGFHSIAHKVRLDDSAPEYLYPRVPDPTRVATTGFAFVDEVEAELAKRASQMTLDVEGVWRDVATNSRYFSLHEKEGKLVLVQLAGIAQASDTLKVSFYGSKSNMLLVQVAVKPNERPEKIRLEFESANEGAMQLFCGFCLEPTENIAIRRVF